MSAINYLPGVASCAGAVFTNLGVRNLYNYFTTADLSQKSGLLKNGALKLAVAVAAYAVLAGNAKLAGTALIMRTLHNFAHINAALIASSIALNIYFDQQISKAECAKLAVFVFIPEGLDLLTLGAARVAELWETTFDLAALAILALGGQQIFSGFRATDVNVQNDKLKSGISLIGMTGVLLAGAIAIRIAK